MKKLVFLFSIVPGITFAGAGYMDSSMYDMMKNATPAQTTVAEPQAAVEVEMPVATTQAYFDISALVLDGMPNRVTPVDAMTFGDFALATRSAMLRAYGNSIRNADFILGSDGRWYVVFNQETSLDEEYSIYRYGNSASSTKFITRDGNVFSLYDVETAPMPSGVMVRRTIKFENMTETQKKALVQFYGPDVEGATLTLLFDNKWYITFAN